MGAPIKDMNRAIVSVATGERFCAGLRRLRTALLPMSESLVAWMDCWPEGAPSQDESPYEFKLHAIEQARREHGAQQVLWLDSSIVPLKPLDELWALIEEQGYWLSRNYDYMNGMFTCDAAYPLLHISHEENWEVPHVVGGAWGVNFDNFVGKTFFEYLQQLALVGAFKGPHAGGSADPRVIGHRHDQTAMSAAAWKLGLNLTTPPEWYAEMGDENETTILVARR